MNIHEQWLYSLPSLRREDLGFFSWKLWCFTYGYWTSTFAEIHFNVKMTKNLGGKLSGMLMD